MGKLIAPEAQKIQKAVDRGDMDVDRAGLIALLQQGRAPLGQRIRSEPLVLRQGLIEGQQAAAVGPHGFGGAPFLAEGVQIGVDLFRMNRNFPVKKGRPVRFSCTCVRRALPHGPITAVSSVRNQHFVYSLPFRNGTEYTSTLRMHMAKA